jgi:hypothetical protein
MHKRGENELISIGFVEPVQGMETVIYKLKSPEVYINCSEFISINFLLV